MRRRLMLVVMAAVEVMTVAGIKAQNDLPGPVTVYPDQANSNDACLRLVSLATSQMVVACAPASLSSTYTIRFPASNSSGVLTNDGSGNLSWGASTGAPFTDASPLIKNDSDPTRLAIISAASISTMTTRNYLLPDFDMTFAARDVDNNFTSLTQTFGGRINLGASGNSGPGIRDNAGVLECTDDGSTWLACGPSSVTNYWNRTGTTITTATAGDVLRLDSHLLLSAPGVSDIADATNYGQTIYMANGDFAPSGLTGNYLKARKLEVADDAGGINFWDIQSQATASTSNFLLRDNAGAPVIRFHRTVGSAPVDYADVYVDLLPDSGGGQKLGQSGKHWSQLWATDVYTNYLHTVSGSDLSFYANLLPITNNTYDIGSSTQRVKKIWTVDLDCSGTCPGSGGSLPVVDTTALVFGSVDATKRVRLEVDGITTGTTRVMTPPNADITIAGINLAQTWTATQTMQHIQFGADNTYDIATTGTRPQVIYTRNIDAAVTGVTGNYTKVRKLEIADLAGGTTFWDTQVSQVGSLSSFQYVRDQAGTVVQRLVQIESGGAVINQAQFMFHLVPGNNSTNADNTYTLGTASRSWSSLFVDTSIVMNGTTRMDSSGNTTVNNLTVNGTCNICSGFFTRSGGDIFPSTNGDDLTVRNAGGTQTHRIRASDGAHLAGAIYTGSSPTWTQRIDSSGNFSGLSLTINSTYSISSSGNALLASITGTSIFANDYRQGANIRINSSGDGNFNALTFGGSSALLQGATTRIGTTGIFNAASYQVGGTSVIDSSRNASFVSLTINGTSLINSSRDISNANSFAISGSAATINSSGVGTFSSLTSNGNLTFGGASSFIQGGTTRINTNGVMIGVNVNITSGLVATPASGGTLYMNGTQLRIRFSSGTDREIVLL